MDFQPVYTLSTSARYFFLCLKLVSNEVSHRRELALTDVVSVWLYKMAEFCNSLISVFEYSALLCYFPSIVHLNSIWVVHILCQDIWDQADMVQDVFFREKETSWGSDPPHLQQSTRISWGWAGPSSDQLHISFASLAYISLSYVGSPHYYSGWVGGGCWILQD